MTNVFEYDLRDTWLKSPKSRTMGKDKTLEKLIAEFDKQVSSRSPGFQEQMAFVSDLVNLVR